MRTHVGLKREHEFRPGSSRSRLAEHTRDPIKSPWCSSIGGRMCVDDARKLDGNDAAKLSSFRAPPTGCGA